MEDSDEVHERKMVQSLTAGEGAEEMQGRGAAEMSDETLSPQDPLQEGMREISCWMAHHDQMLQEFIAQHEHFANKLHQQLDDLISKPDPSNLLQSPKSTSNKSLGGAIQSANTGSTAASPGASPGASMRLGSGLNHISTKFSLLPRIFRSSHRGSPPAHKVESIQPAHKVDSIPETGEAFGYSAVPEPIRYSVGPETRDNSVVSLCSLSKGEHESADMHGYPSWNTLATQATTKANKPSKSQVDRKSVAQVSKKSNGYSVFSRISEARRSARQSATSNRPTGLASYFSPRPFEGVVKKERFSQVERNKKRRIKVNDTASWDMMRLSSLGSSASTTVRRQCVSHLYMAINSQYFDNLCAALLLGNTIFIGCQVEYKALNATSLLPSSYRAVDHAFNIWFLIELLARMAAVGIHDFCTNVEERYWNIFDFFIVLVSTLEMIVSMSVEEGDAGVVSNLPAIRTLRFARIVRVARVVRLMAFFRSLRVLLAAIVSTLKSGVWTAILLMMIFYMFSIVIVQAVAEYRIEQMAAGMDAANLEHYYGTIPRAIFTLLKCILGGVSWEIVSQALSDLHWAYLMLFVFVIAFLMLAVLNVVSGLFLQSALEHAQSDRDHIIQQQIAEKSGYVKHVNVLFNELDSNGDGQISLPEFESHLQDSRMRAFLHSLDIDISDAWTLFKLLDVDGGGYVDVSEFIEGCLRMKGTAKSVHVAQIMYENKWLMDAVCELSESLETSFELLFDYLQKRLAQEKNPQAPPAPKVHSVFGHTACSRAATHSQRQVSAIVPLRSPVVAESIVCGSVMS